MYELLFSLANNKKLTKNFLLDILKKNAREISVFDLMEINALMLKDEKYVQEKYRNEFHGGYAKNFLGRLNQVKDDKNDYSKDFINLIEFKEAITKLKKYQKTAKTNNPKFSKVYGIITLYTTFILNEPIHPVGTIFPGSLKVKKKNGVHYCPVKDAHTKTPNSVCPICIAKQLKFK